MAVTIGAVKAFAKEHNIRAKWNNEWQEWAIRRHADNAACDYFTSDHEDALDQCRFLAGL